MELQKRPKTSLAGLGPILGNWKGTLAVAAVALIVGLAISFGAAYSIGANVTSLVMFGLAGAFVIMSALQHKNAPKKDPRRR